MGVLVYLCMPYLVGSVNGWMQEPTNSTFGQILQSFTACMPSDKCHQDLTTFTVYVTVHTRFPVSLYKHIIANTCKNLKTSRDSEYTAFRGGLALHSKLRTCGYHAVFLHQLVCFHIWTCDCPWPIAVYWLLLFSCILLFLCGSQSY